MGVSSVNNQDPLRNHGPNGVHGPQNRPATSDIDQSTTEVSRTQRDQRPTPTGEESAQTQAQFDLLQDGTTGTGTQAGAATVPPPTQYQNQYPAPVPVPNPDLYSADLPAQSLAVTDGSAFADQARMGMVIDEMLQRSPQLRSIMNNPKYGRGMRNLLILAAITILNHNQKIQGLFEQVSKHGNQLQSVDQTMLMAKLSAEVRDLARATDFASNSMKTGFHDPAMNAIRNMRA